MALFSCFLLVSPLRLELPKENGFLPFTSRVATQGWCQISSLLLVTFPKHEKGWAMSDSSTPLCAQLLARGLACEAGAVYRLLQQGVPKAELQIQSLGSQVSPPPEIQSFPIRVSPVLRVPQGHLKTTRPCCGLRCKPQNRRRPPGGKSCSPPPSAPILPRPTRNSTRTPGAGSWPRPSATRSAR